MAHTHPNTFSTLRLHSHHFTSTIKISIHLSALRERWKRKSERHSNKLEYIVLFSFFELSRFYGKYEAKKWKSAIIFGVSFPPPPLPLLLLRFVLFFFGFFSIHFLTLSWVISLVHITVRVSHVYIFKCCFIWMVCCGEASFISLHFALLGSHTCTLSRWQTTGTWFQLFVSFRFALVYVHSDGLHSVSRMFARSHIHSHCGECVPLSFAALSLSFYTSHCSTHRVRVYRPYRVSLASRQ